MEPENFWDLLENEEGLWGDDIRVGVEEEILDPTHIAVGADSLAAIAERVRGASHIFVSLGFHEELEGFVFQVGHELQWNAMVDDLEEAKLLACLDDERLGLGVREVDHRGGCEEGCGLAWLDGEEVV